MKKTTKEGRIYAAPADLTPHPYNYNRHSAAQVRDLADSLKRFGQRKPVTTWHEYILTGHGVVQAALSLHWPEVWIEPCPDEWDEPTALAWLAADNEIPRAADADEAQLAALVALVAEADEQLAALAAGGEERLRALFDPLEALEEQIADEEELPEVVEEIRPREMARVLVSVPVDKAADARAVLEGLRSIVGVEVVYGAN